MKRLQTLRQQPHTFAKFLKERLPQMYSPNNSPNFTSCLHSSKNSQIAVQTPSVHLPLLAAADAMRAGIQILRDFRAEFAYFSIFGEEFRYLRECGLRSVL